MRRLITIKPPALRVRYDFLGFTHYCAKSRYGKFKLGRETEKARYWQKMKVLWLKGVRNTVKLQVWWKKLKQKLLGHYHYYGIGGNIVAISLFYNEIKRLAYKWINRRSQKKSYNWVQFNRFLKYNPLPLPKIYHPYPIICAGKYY